MTRARVLAAVALLLTLPFTATAITYQVPSDRDLIESVDAIVVGEVVGSSSVESPRGIETVVSLRADRTLKGAVPAGSVDFVVPGGRAGDRFMMIAGAPTYEPGDRVMLFLNRMPSGEWRVRSFAIGTFRFVIGPNGRELLTREANDTEIVGVTSDGSHHEERWRDAATFENYIRQTLENREASDRYVVAAPIESAAANRIHNAGSYSAQEYALVADGHYVRRKDATFSFMYERDQAGSSSERDDLRAGAASWSDEQHSSVAVSVSGPGNGSFGYDGVNDVVFAASSEDEPYLTKGVIAYTRIYGLGTHEFNGETFGTIVETDIFVDKGLTGSLLDVLTHELGHALGFRHSDDGRSPKSSAAVMKTSIGKYNGVLQSWDLNAVQIVYGNGPVCDWPSVSISAADVELVAGNSTTLKASASAREPFNFSWFRDGSKFASGTSSTISTDALSEGDYDFTVEVTDYCGQAQMSPPVTVHVSACTPPQVESVTPASTSVISGQSTSISVALVEGATTPITYQWYKAPEGGSYSQISGSNTAVLDTGALTSTSRFYVTVSNACSSPVPSSEVTIQVTSSCEAPSITTQPKSQTIAPGETAALSVSATGTSLSYQWYQGSRDDLSRPVSGATQPTFTTPVLSSTARFWVRVWNTCGEARSDAAMITVQSCALQITGHPQSRNVTIGWGATLEVKASGEPPLSYQWYEGSSGNESNPVEEATTSRYVFHGITSNTSFWAKVSNECGSVNSHAAKITAVCGPPPPSVAYAPADVLAGVTYLVTWDPIAGASGYEIQEATDSDFNNATTKTVSGNAQSYRHDNPTARRYWYRVRAIASCDSSRGDYSKPVNVAVVPPPTGMELSPTVTVPEGTTGVVNWSYQLWAPEGVTNPTFRASVDRPWLRVEPSTGTIGKDGVHLRVYCTLDGLVAGTTTGTLLIEITPPAGKFAETGHEGSSTSVPVSVSMVTPVTSRPKTSPTDQTLIIPVVGHAAGSNNSQFQSDVRITNTSKAPLEYAILFTPSGTDGRISSKETRLTIASGETKAFNDIVKSWFGFGSTGDSAVGLLEIRPSVGSSGVKPADGRALATVATSRTYNLTPDGTFGQFIPGIPVSAFLSAEHANARLSLQQIAQSSAYRTNLGLVEGAGEPAQIRIRIFDANGSLLKTVTESLAPGEHRQINQFLRQQDVTLTDGRIEIELVSSTGRVSAYASVVDNVTNDPMLVAPKLIEQNLARNWVVPGVADLTNANASWRTDVRLFNAGSAAVTATLTFHPQNASGAPVTRSLLVPAGQVVSMDGVLRSRFDLENTGGAIQITTSADANLIATARTYNQLEAGSFGQFVPAVGSESAVGLGDRTLELLQIEDSTQFRTNLGLVETSGRPVVVEISADAPDLAAKPKMRRTLAANEFTQLNGILKMLNLSTTYNARVTVKVVEGEGHVAAYASVVDNKTQDPTYVPAQ